ncbi:hypothetical protein BST36_10110 [Mycolicibacterium moriokaense]|nr:hypothetical protein BST36_10110 [Mycolicibacterium moriokaense]
MLGAGLVLVDRQGIDLDGPSLSDAQAAEQVIHAARQIVGAAHLQDATGGYSFMSCADENGPPYQATLYMNFRLLHSDWARYLDEVASAMIVYGWVDAPARAEHFGRKLTSGGVVAELQRNVDDPAFGTLRLYGECRNFGDHRNDNPAWTEVSL